MSNPSPERATSSSGLESYPLPEELISSGGDVLALRYDVHTLLPSELGVDWQLDVETLVDLHGRKIILQANDPSCAEDPQTEVSLITLNGAPLIEHFPGLWTLYKGVFRDLMRPECGAHDVVRRRNGFADFGHRIRYFAARECACRR